MASIVTAKFISTFFPRPEIAKFSEEDVEDSDGLEDTSKRIVEEWVKGLDEEFSSAGGSFSADFIKSENFKNTIKINTEGEFTFISQWSQDNRAFRKLAKRTATSMMANLKREYAKNRVKFEFEIREIRITTECFP